MASSNILNAGKLIRPLITARELGGVLGAVKVLDASWYLPNSELKGQQEYEGGHLRGALYFDVDQVADKTSQLPHMLPGFVEFSLAMSGLGLRSSDPIVVYDRLGSLFSAPRVWWMLRAYGHSNVALVDGGYAACLKEQLPVEVGERLPEPTSEAYLPLKRPLMYATKEQVRSHVDSPEASVVILDARPADRFSGSVPEVRPGVASGHIPGSKNMPLSTLYSNEQISPEGAWKKPDQLLALFQRQRIDLRTTSFLTTCGSGMTACSLGFALHLIHLAYPEFPGEFRVYDGSWAEWGSDPSSPIAKG